MGYIKNPKTDGSGILAAIPQKGTCPINCEDCFFQSGRSYLEPLEKNLPNLPSKKMSKNRVVRINDGNDSNNNKEEVIKATKGYEMKFYNTSVPNFDFDAPVVFTINPSKKTNTSWYKLPVIPNNLMFVRIRVNTWNLGDVVVPATLYYSKLNVPVVLTFMAYYELEIPEEHKSYYEFKKRTLNSYYVLNNSKVEEIMNIFVNNKYVYRCCEKGNCERCGNCIREYFVTMERLRND
jgi:hypothetical protein